MIAGVLSRENIKLTIDWWRIRAEVWRLKRRIDMYGLDRALRKILKRLEPKTELLARMAPYASVPFQRRIAQDAPSVLRVINSLAYVREQGITRGIFSQATIATLNRNLKHMQRFYAHVIDFRRIHFPDAPAIPIQEEIEAVRVLSTAAKGFVAYLLMVIAAGIYFGRPVFLGRYESIEAFHYAALIVSSLALLVLTRVLTHLDYWKIEE